MCTHPSGTNAGLSISVELDGLVGTLASAFSYDGLAITDIRAANGPTSGGTAVTLAGVNFGYLSSGRSIEIGSTAVGTGNWLSDSAVVCTHSIGSGAPHDVSVSEDGVMARLEQAFSYDAPVVTAAVPSTVTWNGKGSDVDIFGMNFGAGTAIEAMRVEVGETRCVTSAYMTETSIRCTVAEGAGTNLSVVVVTTMLRGSLPAALSYQMTSAPVIAPLSLA